MFRRAVTGIDAVVVGDDAIGPVGDAAKGVLDLRAVLGKPFVKLFALVRGAGIPQLDDIRIVQ